MAERYVNQGFKIVPDIISVRVSRCYHVFFFNQEMLSTIN